MSTRATRTTRSMTGITISEHASKEFSFCDPEKKFKEFATDPKIRQKNKSKDKSGIEPEERNPLSISDQSLNVKTDASEIRKIILEINELPENAFCDSNNFYGVLDSRALDISTYSSEEHVSGEKNDVISLAHESKVETQVGFANGGKFEKSAKIENAIFSPNNAPGNRSLGRSSKNNQTITDDSLALSNLDKAMVSQKNLLSKSGKILATIPATLKLNTALRTCPVEESHRTPSSTARISRDEDKLCDPKKTLCGSPDDPTKPPLRLATPRSAKEPSTFSPGIGVIPMPLPSREDALTLPLRPEDVLTLPCSEAPEDMRTRPYSEVAAHTPLKVTTTSQDSSEDVLTLPCSGDVRSPSRSEDVPTLSLPQDKKDQFSPKRIALISHPTEGVSTYSLNEPRQPCPQGGDTSPPINLAALEKGLKAWSKIATPESIYGEGDHFHGPSLLLELSHRPWKLITSLGGLTDLLLSLQPPMTEGWTVSENDRRSPLGIPWNECPLWRTKVGTYASETYRILVVADPDLANSPIALWEAHKGLDPQKPSTLESFCW